MTLLRIALLGLLAGCATAEDEAAVDPCITEYLAAFPAGRRLENVAGCNWGEIVSQERADAIQASIAAAHPAGGDAVGYKVTNAEGGRVVGVITSAMLLPSGATVDLTTGARILGESDILVRVGSATINDATTIEEVAAAIAEVIPFIESSDTMLPQGAPRTKPVWTSSNGNARYGFRGEAVDVSDMAPAALVELLGNLQVELIDENGESMQTSGMRFNPLESVLVVIEDMQRRGGIRLQAGDLVSLGNFGRPRFPQPGNSYTAVFHGLADPAPRVVAKYE